MPAEIGFRPVAAADRAMLAAWIARPHWQRWWGPAEAEARHITEDADPDDGRFVFTLDGRDAGYIQWWRPTAATEVPVDAPPETTRGIDMAIADPVNLWRGIGPRVLRAFVARLAGEGVRRFLIDPAPDNTAARRAYAKAGFVAVGEGVNDGGPFVLMVLDLPQPAEAE